MFKKVGDWFSRLWNSKDPTVEVKLIAFLLVTVSGIVWLTIDLFLKVASGDTFTFRGITPNWNSAFLTLAGLVGLGAITDKWSGKIKGGSNDSSSGPSNPE